MQQRRPYDGFGLAVLELLQLEVVEVEVLELLDANKEHDKDEGRAARSA